MTSFWSTNFMILIVIQNIHSYCDYNKCNGPYTLKSPDLIHTKINRATYKATLYYYPDSMPITITKRSFWSNYCYYGTAIDKNTGCIPRYVSLPPSKPEAKLWVERNQCAIGVSCTPYGYCRGDKAKLCFDHKADIWVSGKDHASLGKEFMLFPLHTCVSSWECNFKVVDSTIHAKVDSKSTISAFFSLPNFDVDINETNLEEGVKVDNDTKAYYNNIPTLSSLGVEINCYNNDNTNHRCYVSTENKIVEKGIAFKFDMQMNYGIYRHTVIRIIRPEINVNKFRNEVGEIKDMHDRSNKMIVKIQDASTIGDLSEIIDEVQTLQLQTNLNIIELINNLNEVKSTLIEMTKSISKVDDELIGNILKGKQKTRWFNEDIFMQCPCFSGMMRGNRNCWGPYTYKDGRMTEAKSSNVCTEYDDKEIQRLDLFLHGDYDFNLLTNSPLNQYIKDWEGWTWIAENKDNIIKTLSIASDYSEDKSNNFVELAKKLGVVGWIRWMYNVSSFVAWLALTLTIIRR